MPRILIIPLNVPHLFQCIEQTSKSLENLTMRNNISVVLPLVLLSIILAGCTSTKLVGSWSEANYTNGPLQKILVLAVMKSDMQRRMYEDEFVRKLEDAGVTGITGYSLMPDREDYDNQEEIRAAVSKTGADAALLATLKGVDKQERYVPPRVEYVPSFGYGYGFYDYYGMSHRAVYSPGYTTIDTIVKLETTVFATDSEKMVWAGATESFNPSSAEKVVQENANIIIKDMKKAELL